jgi:hypothetical protein
MHHIGVDNRPLGTSTRGTWLEQCRNTYANLALAACVAAFGSTWNANHDGAFGTRISDSKRLKFPGGRRRDLNCWMERVRECESADMHNCEHPQALYLGLHYIITHHPFLLFKAVQSVYR